MQLLIQIKKFENNGFFFWTIKQILKVFSSLTQFSTLYN